MRYSWLRRLHLWLSLTAALPLLLLSLTGALLVYGHALQDMLQPDLWTVERPTLDAEPLPFSTLAERVVEQKPDARIWSFGLGDRGADKAWSLYLADGGGVLNLDPYSGEILHHHRGDASPYNFVRALHRRWLTADRDVTPYIRHVISAISLVLIGQLIVGLWLWLLPPRRLKRLKVDFRRRPRHVVLRLHQLTGVVTAIILATVAFTGMSLYWHDEIAAVGETVTGQEITTGGDPDFDGTVEVTDIDAAVAAGMAAFPDGRLLHFRAPQPDKPLSLGIQTPDAFFPHRVWVGGDPPRVLAIDDAREANAATWFWRMRYKIHIGDFAGPIVRALWVVVALLPTGYVVSGLWLWLHRRRRQTAGGRATAPAG